MKIFYHNDNDGKAAAAMVYSWANASGIDLDEDDFIMVNYNDSVPSWEKIEYKELVFIVDYSFTKATVGDLYRLAAKSQYNVYWFDHHKSSLEVYDEVKEQELCIKAIVDINRSGAKITYDELIKNNDEVESQYFNRNTVAKVIELVDDYDRWVHKFPGSLLFNIGSTLADTHPMSTFWHHDPDKTVTKGAIIKEYNDAKNAKFVENNGFLIKINGHDCIVLNTPEASSQAFAEYYEKYKFAIRFVYNGKNFTYSIYSGLEDIDCSEIAKWFNPKGGGHKGAAGFVSDKIEISEGMTIII